jgi:hypothetical protein
MQTTTPETMSQPMETETNGQKGAGAGVSSPVDDATYDLLMALASKLEAIDTYKKYAADGQDVWQRIAADDRKHAELLLGKLKERLSTR